MTSTPAGPGPELERLSRAVAAWQKPFAILLVVLGLGCLVVSGYCFKSAYQTEATAEQSEVAPLDGKKVEQFRASQGEFLFGGIVAFAASLVGVVGGGYALGKLPRLTPTGSTPDIRVAAAAGGGVGVLLMILGLGLFVFWFGTLVDWLTTRSTPEAWRVIAALLVFLVGGAVAFVSTQLLRVDERNNQTLRRIAFGTSAVLSVILLLVGLIAGNVLVGLKLPARLDTTASGFYSLHPETAELVKNLTADVTAYTTVTDETTFEEDDRRMAADLKRLLEQCRSINPRRFQYRLLSPTVNKSEIAKLQGEHAEFKRSDLGVLLVAEGKPGRFVPGSELSEFNRQTNKLTFLGEPKLVSLLLSVTEDKDQTVYFLQGHGEISIRATEGGASIRTGNRLSDALQRVDSVVKPLVLELGAAKVPDDAAVLVIADPRSLIPADHLAAVRTYLNAPRTNGKKGKLVVMSGPHPNPDGRGVVDTGLNTLLGEFGIRLGDQYVYFTPTSQLEPNEAEALAGSSPGQQPNPVAVQFARRLPVLVNCREVILDRQRPGGNYVFISNDARATWLEPDPITDPLAALKAMTTGDRNTAIELQRKKQLIQDSRTLAAATSDGNTGRVVVFGSGDAFADPEPNLARKVAANPELLAATVNWLRERPTAASVTGKEVTEYQANKKMDGFKGLLLPVVGTLIATLALGLGVWVYRRK